MKRYIRPAIYYGTLLSLQLFFSTVAQSADITVDSAVGDPGITVSSGDSLTITGTGSILTTQTGTEAVRGSGGGITVTNQGSIKTTGANSMAGESIGVYLLGDTNNVNNSGSIETTNVGAIGISIIGNTNVITNDGTVLTHSLRSWGIRLSGSGNSLTNSGAITTNGGGAAGLYIQGDNTIINTGSIVTHAEMYNGNYPHGIWVAGDNGAITNSGSIVTDGAGAHGIYVNGAGNSGSNSGTVSVTGTGSSGIYLQGDNTFSNSGQISATGNATHAILGDNGNQTVNLLAGSRIIGAFDLGGGTDTVNILAGGSTSGLTFLNTENILLGPGVTGIVSGNTVTTLDPTGEAWRDVALVTLTDGVQQVIQQRLEQNKPLKPIQLASLELSPGMFYRQRKPVVWGQVFGGHRNHDDHGIVSAYENHYRGIVAGYEGDYDKARLGFMGGYAASRIDTDIDSIETNTRSVFVGAYGYLNMGAVNLTVALMGGHEDHDNDRLVLDVVSGLETAKADIDSFFVRPSITVGSAYKLSDHVELRPTATLAYTLSHYDDYTESGTTSSNLHIDDRTTHALTARLQLAAAVNYDANTEWVFRAGIINRHSNNDKVNATLAGTSFKFSADEGDNTQGFIGVNFRAAVKDQVSIVADVEYGGMNTSDEHLSGSISVEYKF